VSERLAVAMRQAEDLILRDYIVSAASQIMAGGGSNGFNPTNLGASDFSLVATTLDTNNAYKFMSGIEGMDRFGTGPVRSAYFMLSSTELQSDFDTLTGAVPPFLNQWNYPSNASALPSEFGSCANIRVLTSSEAPVARNAATDNAGNLNDIYYNTVLGKQAITHINQDGFSMNLIYRDPYYSGMLAQNATLAVKFAQAQALTQDTAIRNLLCTRLSNLGV
jgi:N4-gp56 family major capsid protein